MEQRWPGLSTILVVAVIQALVGFSISVAAKFFIGNALASDIAIAAVLIGVVWVGGLYLVARWRNGSVANAPREHTDAHPRVEFYVGRPTVGRLRGGLVEEIKTVETAWLATQTGDYPTANGVFETRRVQRLILCHPAGTHLPGLAHTAGRTTSAAASTIRESTERASKFGVRVRWLDGPITVMLFGDPESETAWVRVEVPFGFTAVRPGFLIRRSEYEDFFLELKESFDKMWEASVDPDFLPPSAR